MARCLVWFAALLSSRSHGDLATVPTCLHCPYGKSAAGKSTCDPGTEVMVSACKGNTACSWTVATTKGWQEHVGLQFLAIEMAGGGDEQLVPAWDVMVDRTKVCWRPLIKTYPLTVSSFVWGEENVRPWLDLLEKAMPIQRLLVLPFREYGTAYQQRHTNRGDISCLLPVLAARRWPEMHITVWESLPENAELCRLALAHNKVNSHVDMSSDPVGTVLASRQFDKVLFVGNERPLFEGLDCGGFNFMLSSSLVTVDSFRRINLNPKGPRYDGSNVIPRILSMVCAPVAAGFLRGIHKHYGFDLSLWPVIREMPIPLNLHELRADILATPKDIATFHLGSADVKVNTAQRFTFRRRQRVDAIACWPRYKHPIDEDDEDSQHTVIDFAPSPTSGQLVFLLKKSVNTYSIQLSVEMTKAHGFHLRIPDLLDTFAPLMPEKTKMVDSYHWWMLHDVQRGEAYEAAIKMTVKPGQVVADIGTGSGLLAMMSVRAGAAHVHAFEVLAGHVHFAQRIIKRNGFSEQITIHPEMSTRHNDVSAYGISSNVDVVVTETFGGSADGLAESVVKSVFHAKRYLLKPGGSVIPGQMRIWGQLAALPDHGLNAKGIDLVSPYLQLQPDIPAAWPRYVMGSHSFLSEPLLLADIDFMAEDFSDSGQLDVSAVVSKVGVVHGVYLWYEVIFDREGKIVISTKNGHADNASAPFREEHWRTALVPLHVGRGPAMAKMAPVNVRNGDVMRFVARRGESALVLEDIKLTRSMSSVEL